MAGIPLKSINGLPIVDAKKAVKLHVTKHDIDHANRKKPETCAFAQSCLRLKGVKEVRIHLSRAYLRSNDSNWQRFLVSDRLRSEIVAFDRGGRFAPGEYVLQRIPPSARLTGKRKGSDKNQTASAAERKKRKKKRPYHVAVDVRTGPA